MLDTRDVHKPPTNDIINLISLSLNLHYLKKHGTAMCTQMAPSFASILMGKLKKDPLNNVSNTTTIRWRYIDDIFAVWPHGKEELKEFFEEIKFIPLDHHIYCRVVLRVCNIP